MSLKMYLPFMILLFFIGALIAYRDLLGKHKKKVILLSSFLFLTIMFMPFHYFTSNPVLNTGSIIEGLWQLLFDMRIRPEIAESALSRSDNGSVLYFQNVKKALFQSMPFLVLVLLVPFLQRNGRRDKRLILLILPATYIGIYGAQAWHGSVATNMRYFLPTLPFLIIYFVVSFENIFTKKLSVFYIFVLAAVWLLLVITFLRIGRNIWLQEAIILNGSLTLIFALLVNFAFIQIKPEKIQQSIFGVLIFCSLTWSSALVFSRDMVFSLSVRNTFASISKEILPHIPTRSLLLVESPDWVWPIIDRNDKSIIATFENVDCDDLATVVKKFHSTHYLYLITYRESHLNYQSEKCFPIDIDNQSFQTISINLTPHSDFLVKAISNSSE